MARYQRKQHSPRAPGRRIGAPSTRASDQATAEARSAVDGDGSARGGAAEPRPWYIANNVGTGEAPTAQSLRLQRFLRRQRSSSWLIGAAREEADLDRDGGEGWARPLRPARCRWRVAPLVGVHGGDGHRAGHFSGLERCGSVWACPVCSAVIRAERADEIARAWQANVSSGGSGLFVTLTLRHRDGDDLAAMLDHLLNAWRKVQTWRGWRGGKKSEGWRARLGVRGIIRATEITHGAHGWHPHSHLLICTDAPVSDDARQGFAAWLAEAWQKAVGAEGGRLPSQERGVDVRAVEGEGIAGYLAKVQDQKGTPVAREMARGDLKQGRGGSRLPFELLDDQQPGDRERWIAYVQATQGRRAFSWTRGLRDLLLEDETERTDEQIIEETEAGELLASIEGRAWDRRYRDDPLRMAAVLDVADAGDGVKVRNLLGLDLFRGAKRPEPEGPPGRPGVWSRAPGGPECDFSHSI